MAKRYKVQALRIRELCEAQGWSVEDLARYAWISFQTARNLYYGKTVDPTISNAIPIARALGMYVEDLVTPKVDEVLPGEAAARPARSPQRQDGPFRVKRLLVKDASNAHNWSTDELARASWVNFNTTRGVLYGTTLDPTISTLLPIAHAFGKHVEELVEAEETDANIRTPLGSELVTA